MPAVVSRTPYRSCWTSWVRLISPLSIRASMVVPLMCAYRGAMTSRVPAALVDDGLTAGERGEAPALGFADLDVGGAGAEVLPRRPFLGVEVAVVPQQGAAYVLDGHRRSVQVRAGMLQQLVGRGGVAVGEGGDGVRCARGGVRGGLGESTEDGDRFLAVDGGRRIGE